MICAVLPRRHQVLAGCALLAAACVLASCGDSPAPKRHALRTTTTSTTTTTTAPQPTTTTAPPGVAVPDVVGMKVDLARFYLKTAGFKAVPLNAPCNKGSLPSESVVASLSVPGPPPNVATGAQALAPGTPLPKGARVGITWSPCYPAGTQVPAVVGHTFLNAVHLLRLAGLTWACYSVGSPTTTTTHPTTATTKPGTSSTTSPPTTTTTKPLAGVILTQGTAAGTVVNAGAVVNLTMHHCLQ